MLVGMHSFPLEIESRTRSRDRDLAASSDSQASSERAYIARICKKKSFRPDKPASSRGNPCSALPRVCCIKKKFFFFFLVQSSVFELLWPQMSR